MTINLKNDYKIVATKHSYDLVKDRVSKNNKKYEENIGYFPNIAMALKRYIEVAIVDNDDVIELNEYIERYEELVKEVLSHE